MPNKIGKFTWSEKPIKNLPHRLKNMCRQEITIKANNGAETLPVHGKFFTVLCTTAPVHIIGTGSHELLLDCSFNSGDERTLDKKLWDLVFINKNDAEITVVFIMHD